MDSSIVTVKDVSKRFFLGDKEIWALRNINLEIKPGEFVAISGASGSGKTTLLNLIGCLDLPTSGEILISGESTAQLNDQQQSLFRNQHIGIVFQTFNLLPVLTAQENVEYPLLKSKLSAKERQERAVSWLTQVGLGGHTRNRPDQLSGGQRQRVAIARALATQPKLVIADEPTANLDRTNAAEIIKLMKNLSQLTKITFIFSTHDHMIMDAADRVVPIAYGALET